MSEDNIIEGESIDEELRDDADDDDIPVLSEHTLAALREFYLEQAAEDEESTTGIREDWLSQFWYDDSTASRLAEEALSVVKPGGSIACISCPTLYSKLHELDPTERSILCLEYDERFKRFGDDFVFYDYNDPLNIPAHYEHKFDLLVCDPPFLSEECLRKTSMTIHFMAKEGGAILLCTGAIMEELAKELLGVRICQFHPRHTNNLSNEFRCFTNYKPNIIDNIS